MYKVAIITRTKDRPTFLARALKSVASQSYEDYVHVVVNDGGSKKDVERVIAGIDNEHRAKIKIFHRKESSGAPDTIFNESIDRVDSKYFAIHDDDDTWHKEFLAETVRHLEDRKYLAAVVVRTDKIVEEVEDVVIKQKKKTQWMADLKVINLYRQCIDNQFTPISTLFRRSSYVDIGKFDSSLPVVGDWEFGIRLLMRYDADFIDPGYALANYHHRKKIGNSSQDPVSSDEKHRYYTNKIMNSFLRKEFSNGSLGVGYVMSKLKYNQRLISSLFSRFMPTKLHRVLKRKFRE